MIAPGSTVLVRGQDGLGTVLDIRGDFANISLGSQLSWIPTNDLIDISDDLLNKLIGGSPDDALDLILTVDANRLLNEYRFNPYVLASSTKITILPHQIDEVMWGLERDRIMIADEVGLGKTIISALIAAELKSRGLADKTLYVVPKSLVLKWQDELSGRFDIEATILDAQYLKYDPHPFSHVQYDYITSMDFLKNEERKRLLTKDIDLVVVDEAHKFKLNTMRLKLGETLSERANSLILLTATPHDGRDEDFMARMFLLDNSVSDITSSEYLWRRHVKENVIDINGKTLFPKRTSRTINIQLTNRERQIHQMIDDYIRARGDAAITRLDHSAVLFLSTIFKKRTASSVKALEITLQRRRERLGAISSSSITKSQATVESMEDDNEEDYEDRISDIEWITIGDDTGEERDEITRILSQIAELGDTDSKLDELQKCIEKAKTEHQTAKILLFSEYRDTLDYLEGKLSRRYKTGRIDGTMNIQERKKALSEFAQDSGPEILLCTDAAGEGIDMQFCNVEFNYDIPWNPNRLEQRMGRIHRIGQRKEVFYYNFIMDKDNTIDGYILDMLLEKIEKMKEAMGNDSIFDIMGRIINQDMIAEIYIELLRSPKAQWEATVVSKMEEIQENRERILEHTRKLLEGHKLDHTALENIQKIKRDAVDFRDVKRFIETWAESSGGKFQIENEKLKTAKIIPPQSMASQVKIIQGTFDRDIAQSRGFDYIALGNKQIQTVLSRVSEKRAATILSHATREGLVCVYMVSVIDGRGRMQNAKTITLFHNEDGSIGEIEPQSLWSYKSGDVILNTKLVADAKARLDKRMAEIGNEFHGTVAEKLKVVKMQNIDAADRYAIAKIDEINTKIEEYTAKLHDAPHYERLIERENTKIKNIRSDSKRRKTDIAKNFKSYVAIKLIAIAWVVADADANERAMTDRQGMKLVMKYEGDRATTDEERRQIRDVSERDKGYDIESAGRCIEVKSFKGTGIPSLTSHEWETAGRIGDDYWLYVVEDAFNESKSPKDKIISIQNPYDTLKEAITPVEKTTLTYQIADWSSIKSRFA